jgi:hypothetical protein
MSESINFSEVQIKAIKGYCDEMSASMTRSEGERDFQKEATVAISKEYEISKPLLKKLARIFHKSKFSTVQEENTELENSYLAIFGTQDDNSN